MFDGGPFLEIGVDICCPHVGYLGVRLHGVVFLLKERLFPALLSLLLTSLHCMPDGIPLRFLRFVSALLCRGGCPRLRVDLPFWRVW